MKTQQNELYFISINYKLPIMKVFNIDVNISNKNYDLHKNYVVAKYLKWHKCCAYPYVEIIEVEGLINDSQVEGRIILKENDVVTDKFDTKLEKEAK